MTAEELPIIRGVDEQIPVGKPGKIAGFYRGLVSLGREGSQGQDIIDCWWNIIRWFKSTEEVSK
ncbi:MAG TPA: hypothetical protein ENN91_00545 [Firmicutes bacterium]|nr:hypothetical protein [Bacillota bacterium]